MLKLNNKAALIFIILAGFLLRIFLVDKFPVSLNWDEVSHGYNAYTISKYGVDEWGSKSPLIFRAFGDFKLPVYIYLTAIFTKIFGTSAIIVRLTSVLAGSFAILGIYLVAEKLFSKKVGLISAFLLAITPWHFFISRPALEANLALTLVIFAFHYLLKVEDGKRFGFLSALLFGLSIHSYNSERFFVPVFIALYLTIFKRKQYKKYLLFGLTILVFLIPVFFQTISGDGLARFEKLKILDESAVYQIGNSYQNSKLPPPVAKLVHNKPVFLIKTVFSKYLNYFSPNFLNQGIGSHSQFAIPGQNLLGLPIELAVILYLVFSLVSKKSDRRPMSLLLWFLLAPLAGSLTKEPAHVLRGSLMILPLIIFAAVSISSFNHKLLVFFLGLQIIIFSQYLVIYYKDYSTRYAPSWQYGYQQLYETLSLEKKVNQKIIITKAYGEPHIFLSYFKGLSPFVLNDPNISIRFYQSGWYWTDKIDDYYFVNDWDIPESIDRTITLEHKEVVDTTGALLVTTKENTPKNVKKIKEINYPNGDVSFIISLIP